MNKNRYLYPRFLLRRHLNFGSNFTGFSNYTIEAQVKAPVKKTIPGPVPTKKIESLNLISCVHFKKGLKTCISK